MGLMETMQKIIDLCISIQESLNHMIDMLGHVNGFQKSMIELSAVDVLALEKNVKLLAGYKEDIDYIIEKLSYLAGNIQVLFWLLMALVIMALTGSLFLIGKTIYENRDKIFKWIEERKSKNVRNKPEI